MKENGEKKVKYKQMHSQHKQVQYTRVDILMHFTILTEANRRNER